MAAPDHPSRSRLPPPPAPTHRSANPWRLSDTARKPDQPGRGERQESLEEILRAIGVVDVPAQEEPAKTPDAVEPGRTAPARRTSSWLPLLFFIIAAGVVLFELSQQRGTDDWVTALGPLVVILLMALTWWRRRRKNEEQGNR
ncbi:MAG: hypothetical protein FJ191_01760 [Gammaproteobacteria bacterium]|nr:hypothetical protein [Gammaproteobacteria bacterium]